MAEPIDTFLQKAVSFPFSALCAYCEPAPIGIWGRNVPEPGGGGERTGSVARISTSEFFKKILFKFL